MATAIMEEGSINVDYSPTNVRKMVDITEIRGELMDGLIGEVQRVRGKGQWARASAISEKHSAMDNQRWALGYAQYAMGNGK